MSEIYLQSEWKTANDEPFIYALNSRGTNRFWLSVQHGWTDEGERTSDEDLSKIARLIAAAPELLEALESALKTAEFEKHPFRPWHEVARAAIAKATGES